MQDAIIKGTGNSRYLKSVSNFATLYPTYADFVQALVEGTLPIDLNGTNAAGFTQTGTALNKANLLPDATATALGIPTSATVADAFGILSVIPDGKSLIIVHCADNEGRPVSGCVMTASNVVARTNGLGVAAINSNAGTISVSIRAPIDYGANGSTFSVEGRAGSVSVVDCTITDTLNGAKQIDITTTMSAAFSDRVNSADVFCVGGGGSGCATGMGYAYTSRPVVGATGGGSGYTQTKKNIELGIYVISVGSGGSARELTLSGYNSYLFSEGENGGTTSVSVHGSNTILSANGGAGGAEGTPHVGANGGSGSGAVATTTAGNSGSDGTDGGEVTSNGAKYRGGTGQGTTTRAFGDSDGELFASAGGSGAAGNGYSVNGAVGPGGGSAYCEGGIDHSDFFIGGSGSTAGSGGGAVAVTLNTNGALTIKSGAGAAGLVRFRWEVK